MEKTVGRTHLWRSLRTSNKAEAVRAARLVAGDFERWLSGTEIAATEPLRSATGGEAKREVLPSRTVEDLFRLFLSDPSKQRNPKTEMHYENLREMVFELWGKDTPITGIGRDACRDLLDVLRWLPSNQSKRFPKLGVVQAARLAKEEGLPSTLSAATVNGYMTKLRTLSPATLRQAPEG